MQVEVDQAQVQAVRDLLADIGKNANPVLVRSLNRTATGVRSNVVDLIGAKLATAKRNIRDKTAITKAHKALLSARVVLRGRRLPLTLFGARQGVRGTSFKVWRDQARERMRHAFIRQMPTGHSGVYERQRSSPRYDGRLPLEEKMGPAVQTVFNQTPGIEQTAMSGAGARLVRELDAQVALILSKHKNAAV